MKSRALWIKCGDNNTRFFHNYVNHRRIYNAIWDIPDSNGAVVNTQRELSFEASKYFKSIFTDPGVTRIDSQLKVLQQIPRLFVEEDNRILERHVTLLELENILKSCAKDKSPGLDGWTVEFYLGLWDLVGTEVLQMLEETRRTGLITVALNSTFIALIPKNSKPASFDEFCPISLCNFIYKIRSKVIAERIKPLLFNAITSEQFGFLTHRQILDVVGIAQEGIHKIKTKQIPATLLKMDLKKAYDRIDWGYLRLLLLHVGLSFDMVTWIMGCVTNVHFSVLVNGSPTVCFKGQRGLRQGCPLSPLLFLLVINGLSQLIGVAKMNGTIHGYMSLLHIILPISYLLTMFCCLGEITGRNGIPFMRLKLYFA